MRSLLTSSHGSSHLCDVSDLLATARAGKCAVSSRPPPFLREIGTTKTRSRTTENTEDNTETKSKRQHVQCAAFLGPGPGVDSAWSNEVLPLHGASTDRPSSGSRPGGARESEDSREWRLAQRGRAVCHALSALRLIGVLIELPILENPHAAEKTNKPRPAGGSRRGAKFRVSRLRSGYSALYQYSTPGVWPYR